MSTSSVGRIERRPAAAGLLALLVLAKLGLHLASCQRYGVFRDEMYYLACGLRPAWGYVDHPPLVPFLARAAAALLGDSLPAIRLPALLATAGVVLVTGLMVRRLGGGRYATLLAGLAVLLSPAFLVMGTFLSVNALDMLWWALAQYLVLTIFVPADHAGACPRTPASCPRTPASSPRTPASSPRKRGSTISGGMDSRLHGNDGGGTGVEQTRCGVDADPKSVMSPFPGPTWLLVGAVIGLGLLTKYTMLFFCAGLAVGLLATVQRRQLGSAWLWGGALVAALIAAPHLAWQVQNDWPTTEFLRNIRLHKNYPVTPFEFVAMQAVVLHPLVFALAMIGLVGLLRGPRLAAGRPLGWAYLATALTLLVLRAKFYYLFPAYPILLAAGGVGLEDRLSRVRWPKARVAAPLALVLGCVPFLPYALPILPFETFLGYDRILRINRQLKFEKGRVGGQAIVYADMFGWRELAAELARIFHTLPPEDQTQCTILTLNYGQAGAVERYGRALGLPAPVSGHNSYFQWGPGPQPWKTVLAVGLDPALLAELFAECVPAGVIENPWAREARVEVHVCRGLRVAPEEAWRRLKRFR